MFDDEKYSMKAFDRCVEIILPEIYQANKENKNMFNRPEVLKIAAYRYFSEYHDYTFKENLAFAILKDFAINFKKDGVLTFGTKDFDLQ